MCGEKLKPHIHTRYSGAEVTQIFLGGSLLGTGVGDGWNQRTERESTILSVLDAKTLSADRNFQIERYKNKGTRLGACSHSPFTVINCNGPQSVGLIKLSLSCHQVLYSISD